MKVYTVEGPSDEGYGARLLVVGVGDAITPDGVDKSLSMLTDFSPALSGGHRPITPG